MVSNDVGLDQGQSVGRAVAADDHSHTCLFSRVRSTICERRRVHIGLGLASMESGDKLRARQVDPIDRCSPSLVRSQETNECASGFLATMVQLGSGGGLFTYGLLHGAHQDRWIFLVFPVVILATLIPTSLAAAGEGPVGTPRYEPVLPHRPSPGS